MTKTCLIGCALLISVETAAAEVVVDWNIQAGQTIGAGARRGPSGSFDFAMVHATMHDAVQAFEHRFEPYCADIPKASGSPVAAAAAAAHAVLSALFPAQAEALDAAYDASVAKYMVQGDAGALIGQQAAACVLERLAADSVARAVPDSFLGGNGPGECRPTTITPAGVAVPMIGGFVATFQPFTMTSPSQFRASAPPPHLTSGAYAKAYDQVKTLGARVGSTRTPEQTNIAAFFADAPVGYWSRTVQALIASHGLDLGESARLFAFVDTVALRQGSHVAAWVFTHFLRPIGSN